MNSIELTKAREYEEQFGNQIPKQERAAFHLTPYVGWMNDPNGFSYYDGRYHLFYQYYPYDTSWGPMHWGHAVSKDLIKWEYLPAALAPDKSFDAFGCWSGSGLETPDGKHALLYTGVVENSQDKSLTQAQCLAIGDGIQYEKYEKNPVIDPTLLPEGASKADFRDPKMWYDKEEQAYYAVVGNRAADGSGAILLFRSPDLKNWTYVTTLDQSENKLGKMWECPDFFPLDGEYALLISPQEMRASELEFHYGNCTMCILGHYDKEKHTWERHSVQSIDQGLDYYASTTTKAPDGRRIMIGWMQSWESCRNQPQGNHFFGTMSIPRELSVKDGRLMQSPVRELEGYRKNQVHYKDVEIIEEKSLEGVHGRILDLELSLDMPMAASGDVFTMTLAKDEENGTLVQYFPESGLLRFDRNESGFNCDMLNVRELQATKGSVNLRILLDRYSAEIFVNDGERVLTSTFYTPLTATEITFSASRKTKMNISKWDLQ